jgi:osmotically-inducible protein OsmY
LWLDAGKVDVEVDRGVVELSGRLHKRSDVELLDRLAARIPGVLSVESTVLWEVDDSTRKGRRALEQTRR